MGYNQEINIDEIDIAITEDGEIIDESEDK